MMIKIIVINLIGSQPNNHSTEETIHRIIVNYNFKSSLCDYLDVR